MDTFFPPRALDQKPLQPSKAEQISSRLISVALVPALALQTIGAAPRHALRDAGLGAVGEALDSFFDLFHGAVSAAIPRVANWADALGATVAQGLYFGALTVAAGALTASVVFGMRRAQKNFDCRVGGPRCW
jgi:hypothetical protein